MFDAALKVVTRKSRRRGEIFSWHQRVADEQSGRCAGRYTPTTGCRRRRALPGSAGRRVPDRYVYNPEDPLPTWAESISSSLRGTMRGMPGPFDQQDLERRKDCCLHDSMLRGMSSDRSDNAGAACGIVRAGHGFRRQDYDVHPNGRSISFPRESSGTVQGVDLEKPKLLTPGRCTISYRTLADQQRVQEGPPHPVDGYRQQLPLFDRNQPAAGWVGRGDAAAEQTIRHDFGTRRGHFAAGTAADKRG